MTRTVKTAPTGTLRTRAAALRSRVSRRGRPLPLWWPLPLCAALGAAAGAGYATQAEPRYAATSYVVVTPAKDAEPGTALGFAQAYGRLVTDPVVLKGARSAPGLPDGPLRGHVESQTSPDAPMIEIVGTAAQPAQAANVANAVARSLADAARTSAQQTGARLTLLSPALRPDVPVSPTPALALGVGACAGGLVGGLALLVRPREQRPAPVQAALPAPSAGPPAQGAEPVEAAR
ncbi:lipopolysaccharide biosynthesis protein [Streptomyces sp. NPDC059740]|uniref:lipopolysaccharide biosynthesis protein n=1 Tax=Streptomyces sp. NPDC059740 TaxID=3346926 RepID=UPI003650313D